MALNPFQKAVEQLENQLKRQGYRGSVYAHPEYPKFVSRYFGEIPLPAGVPESQVTSRSAFDVEYRDADGYIHRLTRLVDGRSPDLGVVRETSTNRPAVLPASTQQQEAQKTSLQQLMDLFAKQATASTTSTLAQLDTQTMADLEAISNSENLALQEQFQTGQGKLLAQLFGQGIPQSSIATQAASDLQQGQGLVRSQAQGQQAQRKIDLRNVLTQLGQQQQQFQQTSLQQLVADLTGQQLSRDVVGGQLGIEQQKLSEDQRRYNTQLLQEQLRYDEALRQQKRQSMWNNIFKGVSLGTSVLGSLFGAGGLIGGAGAASGAGTGTSVPTGVGPPV